jgi:outer membrane protein TolC
LLTTATQVGKPEESASLLTADGITTSPEAYLASFLAGSSLTTSTLVLSGPQVRLPEAAPIPIDQIRGLLRSSGKGLIRYSPMSAVMASLSANRELAVQKLRPSISEQGIDSALSEFDPVLRAAVSAGEARRAVLGARPRVTGVDTRDQDRAVTSRETDGQVSMGARIPTGTNLSIDLSAARDSTNQTRDFYGADATINVTQNILRGRGVAFNMARVRIARNDLDISRHQLEAFLINLVSDTLLAYADLYLARETLRIRIESWEVAGQQADQSDEFLRVGRVTPLASLTARAEQSSRAGDVINAAAQLRNRQLALLRLTGGLPRTQGRNYLADLSLGQMPVPIIVPKAPNETVVPAERVRVAMTLRPELPQARLELTNGELEVVRTSNGLLPRLDFVVRAVTSGVGDTFADAYDRANSFDYGSWRTGLELEVPLGNRAARAADRRARFSRDLAEAALGNQRQQVELDMLRALVEVERTQRLILTTGLERRQREEALFNERQRLSVGAGTRLEVIQAERDLIQAQINEVSAEVDVARAFIELHRAEGSTLLRTGVSPIASMTIQRASETTKKSPIRLSPRGLPDLSPESQPRNSTR